MTTDEITIHVNPTVAEAYWSASEEDRRKMNLMVDSQLTELLQPPHPLGNILGDASRQGQLFGAAPIGLESILHD